MNDVPDREAAYEKMRARRAAAFEEDEPIEEPAVTDPEPQGPSSIFGRPKVITLDRLRRERTQD
jgi:hypothetical protein